MPLAQRVIAQDIGATDAPIRALALLILAPALVILGCVMVILGARWLRRLGVPDTGPSAIEPDEATAVLVRQQAPAYGDGPRPPYWPLRRWLSDQLGDLTWWRRDIMGRGLRALVLACGMLLLIAACFLALPYIINEDLLGPFPTTFAIVLPIAMAAWAVLSLMLISSHSPRIEAVELPASARHGVGAELFETPPHLLHVEPPGLGNTLGVLGIALQCLLPVWWDLSPIGYPLLATSLVRHAASILAGILFFVLGTRVLGTAAELLLHFRYESTLVMIDANGSARAAAIRTESRGLAGPRHVIAAVGGNQVREAAEQLINDPPARTKR